MTLAIIRALVVGVSGRIYAVPLNSVLEILSVAADEHPHHRAARGDRACAGRRCRSSGWRACSASPSRDSGARTSWWWWAWRRSGVGIAVDELLGQQDIVTKPLGGRLQDVRGIAGATDLGNRRTVLVLDVGALMEEVLHASTPRRIA